jgi:hypothetical protein
MINPRRIYLFWNNKIINLIIILIFSITGCGGDSDPKSCDGSSPPGTGGCTYTVKVNRFQVVGNDTAANEREQIVAGINNGSFSISMDLSPVDSDDVTLWISNSENLSSTNLEQMFLHLKCGYYPFCEFENVLLSCSYSTENKVACTPGGVGSGPIQADYPAADITQLLSGNQTDLFVILVAGANGAVSSQKIIPVTFRYN